MLVYARVSLHNKENIRPIIMTSLVIYLKELQSHFLMRLSVYCLIAILCSCSDSQRRDKAYAPPYANSKVASPSDSTITVQQVSMYNELYTLQLTKYIKSDTLIATRILLEKDKKEVFKTDINVYSFPTISDRSSFRPAVLLDVSYSFVRSNRLYFTSVLKSLRTGKEKKPEFAIFYQTQKRGQMDYWPKYDDAGN